MHAHPRKHVYMSKSACTIMGPPAFSSSVAGLFFERTDNSPSYSQTIQCRGSLRAHPKSSCSDQQARPLYHRYLWLRGKLRRPPSPGQGQKSHRVVDHSGLSSCVLLNPELLLLGVSNPAGVILKQSNMQKTHTKSTLRF